MLTQDEDDEEEVDQKKKNNNTQELDFDLFDDDHTKTKDTMTLEFIRVQLKELDTCMASDTTILRKKIEQVDKQLIEANTKLYQATYHLTEATFELEEHEEMFQHFVQQFETLAQIAFQKILPATGTGTTETKPFTGSTTTTTTLPVLHLSLHRLQEDTKNKTKSPKMNNNSKTNEKEQQQWNQKLLKIEKDLEFFQQFTIGTTTPSTTQSTSPSTAGSLFGKIFSSTKIKKTKTNNNLLKETSIGSDLIFIQQKFHSVKQLNIQLKQRFGELQKNYQIAQVEVEELQFFKDCLSDQFLQLLFANERKKDMKILQEFCLDDTRKNSCIISTTNLTILQERTEESRTGGYSDQKTTSSNGNNTPVDIHVGKQIESILLRTNLVEKSTRTTGTLDT
jgi:hypothetical protein